MGNMIEVYFYDDNKCVNTEMYKTDFVPRIGEEIWHKSVYYTVYSVSYEHYEKDPALQDGRLGLDVYVKAKK